MLLQEQAVSRHRQSPELIIAEDDEASRHLLELLARQRGYSVESTVAGEEAMMMVGIDTRVVVLDLEMPGWDGFRCLEYLRDRHPAVSAIVLTASDQAASAVKALKLGALDYVTKPFDPEDLFRALRTAFEMSRVREENRELRDSIGDSSVRPGVVADSKKMRVILERVRKVARLESSVLLTGESGVGKGLVARLLHSMSPRASGPFITVSCPALPRELLESELFGHEKGAFTGALRKRIGKIEAAAGGTLFLDEIGDLPIELQPKLLNVLQDRQFQRVGGEETIRADFRLVSATNIDFAERIASGLFREDLFFRLNVVPIEIPPLRARKEEIEGLTKSILGRIAAQRAEQVLRVTKGAMNSLRMHGWPGNVRELENVLERASVFCEGGEIDEEDLVDLGIFGKSGRAESGGAGPLGLAGYPLAVIEARAVLETLEMCGGNKAKAARLLGITERSIYNHLRRLESEGRTKEKKLSS
jgi:DNA-binding NtrC family response regulator